MHRLLILVLFVGLTSIHLCGQISHDPTKIKGYKVISDILQDAIQSALENKYDSAHNKMNLAYNIAQDKSYIELVPIILMAQSRLYVSEQDYPRASEKIKLAEPFFKDDTITSIAGDFYDFQAQSYLHLNKLSEALAAIQKCEKIRLHIEPGKNWRTYIGMGRIYNKMGNTKTAEIYFQKSEKHFLFYQLKFALQCGVDSQYIFRPVDHRT